MKLTYVALGALLCAPASFAVEEVMHDIHGTVIRLEKATKTVVIRTADGTESALRFAGKTIVHGTEAAAKDTFHGLKEGSEVVAHYAVKGTEKTAIEIDRLGKEGMKTTEGALVEVDKGGKKAVVKTADGVESTFVLGDHAIADAGKDIGRGASKSARVTVYYTEEGGRKVAHFFEKL